MLLLLRTTREPDDATGLCPSLTVSLLASLLAPPAPEDEATPASHPHEPTADNAGE